MAWGGPFGGEFSSEEVAVGGVGSRPCIADAPVINEPSGLAQASDCESLRNSVGNRPIRLFGPGETS